MSRSPALLGSALSAALLLAACGDQPSPTPSGTAPAPADASAHDAAPPNATPANATPANTTPDSGASASDATASSGNETADAGGGATEVTSFDHGDPGVLPPGTGHGVPDPTIWGPGIRFPIKDGPAFANSQVYGHGGGSGPAGTGQCDAANFSYPWHDNFCETRAQPNGLCIGNLGHQGQDIRASTCHPGVHPVVAVADGTVTHIGSFSLFLTTPDGSRTYRYLHMSHLAVHEGESVSRGQVIGMVDHVYPPHNATTTHLHFEIKAPVTESGHTVITFVPPYASLVDAYGRMLAGTP